MKIFNFIFAVLLISFASGSGAATLPYTLGEAYCALTHPTEFIFKLGNKRSTCEEQHVIQQQSGGGDIANVVWWPASHHVRTDVYGSQPWQNNRPWIVLGFTQDNKVNLEKAYMMGTHGLTWSLFQHSYNGRGPSKLIAFEFDGVSNLLYGFAWLVNTPQKYVNQMAYLVDKGHWVLIIDMLILIFVLAIEMLVALVVTVGGAVAGLIFNPVDTLFAIPGGIWLALEACIAAVFQLVVGVWGLLTAGVIGIIMAPITLIMSFLPFAALGKLNQR